MAQVQHRDGLGLLRSDVRRRLYGLVSDRAATPPGAGPVGSAGLSAQELADEVGLHLTTVRFHLDQLVAAGLLMTVQARPVGAGRPRKLYILPGLPPQPPTDPEARRAYAALTEVVGQAGASAPSLLEASGRAWVQERLERTSQAGADREPATTPGAWLGKLGVVIDLLVGWGHAPEVRTSSGSREVDILLRDCPFLALAKEQPHLVCGVHRGLLRGALDALGEQSAGLDLQPLVDRHTCRAHLSVTTPFPDRGEAK